MSTAFFSSYTNNDILARCGEIEKNLEQCLTTDPSQAAIRSVLIYTLASQSEDGSWHNLGGNWTCLQTALALKALSQIGYTEASTWPIVEANSRRNGSVRRALDFLCHEINQVSLTTFQSTNIEDIWDMCQVILALQSYNRNDAVRPIVAKISSDWQNIYKASFATSTWSGPAFLAAMIEVLINSGAGSSTLNAMIAHLLSLEQSSAYNAFLWSTSYNNEPCWHASLVLTLLCRLPEDLLPLTKKIDLTKRIVPALLAQRKNSDDVLHQHWGVHTPIAQDWPMYTARVLDALVRACPYADASLIIDLEDAINRGNQFLSSLVKSSWTTNIPPMNSMKSTLAVAEYFASLKVPAPAFTVLQTSEILPSVANGVQFAQSPMASEQCIKLIDGGLRLAWLSDLHIADVEDPKPILFKGVVKQTKWFRTIMIPQNHYWAEPFAKNNLAVIFERLKYLKPNRILITGDVTNLALPNQFKLAREMMINLQATLCRDVPPDTMSPELWTILPGNHDVSSQQAVARLQYFSNAFAETYSLERKASTCCFPVRKIITSPLPDSPLRIELIGLDSTPESPVQIIGMNAKGRLEKNQLDELSKILSVPTAPSSLRLVALHHHPLVIPYIKSELIEHFMQLENVDAIRLLNLCSTHKVQAVLHGHFHTYSTWFAPIGAPDRITGFMPVIGSASGTVGNPDTNVEFLELRECDVETVKGLRRGMALYRQKYDATANPKWSESALGVVLYSEI